MTDEFDLWLEDELGKGYARLSMTQPPAGAPYRTEVPSIGFRGLPRAPRAAIVIAAVAIGLIGSTALAAATVTGSANPQAWGQYVKDAVSTCKSELGNGQHGIGQCMRAFAHQKGSQNGDEHSNGNGNGNGNGKTHRSPKGRPSGTPGVPSSGTP